MIQNRDTSLQTTQTLAVKYYQIIFDPIHRPRGFNRSIGNFTCGMSVGRGSICQSVADCTNYKGL